LSLGGEPAGKHETCRDQRKEPDSTADEVQKTVPAYGVGICWSSRRKAKGRISNEEASADQS
jgi:hypothetical protein